MTELRRRIRRRWISVLANVAWVAWLAVKLVAAGLILLVLETAVFYMALGNATAFLIAFVAGNASLLLYAAMKAMRRFPWRKVKGGILLGRSFRHLTEQASSDEPVAVGKDSICCVDYVHEPNPHVLMLGSTSSGKTTTMRSFVARTAIANRVPFLVIDWNGENEGWAKRIGASVWRVPEHFKVNPFKLDGMRSEARASIAVETLAASAHLTGLQSTKVKSSLLRFYMVGKEPSLFELWRAICYRKASKANVLDQRLRAVQRVIGYEPAEFWKGIFDRNNVVSLAGLNQSEKSLVAYAVLQRLTELFDREPWTAPQPRLMVVLDEAWQLLRKEKEYDFSRESVAERIVRVGRKYGIGIIISTQQIDDMPKVFVNSSALLMLHQHREASYFGRELLRLNVYEKAYINAAAQGELLLFDRGRMQAGEPHPEYVKVRALGETEERRLAGAGNAYAPGKINEPEMPIEVYSEEGGEVEGTDDSESKGVLRGLDIPSVVIYRFMVALTRSGGLKNAYKMLKEKGWVTSDTTIYGNKSKSSLLDRAKASGYVSLEGKLTTKGLDVIDPNHLIAKQGIYAGSEEHKELMRKTINLIQDRGNFACTLSDKDAFDVGEIPAKTRSVWDLEHLKIYECQMNAIREEIQKGVDRALRFRVGLVFVTTSRELANNISIAVENKYGVAVI